jgi:hypothetical protein
MRRRLAVSIIFTLLVVAQTTPGHENVATVSSQEVIDRINQFHARPVPNWKMIPWAGSLSQAREVSRREHRPIFVFTCHGSFLTGRC